jgi:transposase-like protein
MYPGVNKMVAIALKCPFCNSENVRKDGFKNGKQRYQCKNQECGHKTFYGEYTNNACNPAIKSQIVKMSVDGSGIRTISRVLGISTDTVISELKKKKSWFHSSTKVTSKRITI